MKVRTIRKADLLGTPRHVRHELYDTVRFLLAGGGEAVTVTDNTLVPGREAICGYDNHTEIVNRLEGEAELEEIGRGQVLPIRPGTVWVSRPGARFRFVAHQPTRVICVSPRPSRAARPGSPATSDGRRRSRSMPRSPPLTTRIVMPVHQPVIMLRHRRQLRLRRLPALAACKVVAVHQPVIMVVVHRRFSFNGWVGIARPRCCGPSPWCCSGRRSPPSPPRRNSPRRLRAGAAPR